jgi:hypothetical protein
VKHAASPSSWAVVCSVVAVATWLTAAVQRPVHCTAQCGPAGQHARPRQNGSEGRGGQLVEATLVVGLFDEPRPLSHPWGFGLSEHALAPPCSWVLTLWWLLDRRRARTGRCVKRFGLDAITLSANGSGRLDLEGGALSRDSPRSLSFAWAAADCRRAGQNLRVASRSALWCAGTAGDGAGYHHTTFNHL